MRGITQAAEKGKMQLILKRNSIRSKNRAKRKIMLRKIGSTVTSKKKSANYFKKSAL